MLCDDLGYGDIQCLNPQRGKIPTPHVDRLSKEGMTFTDAHSGSSVCTPTRYGLLTGRYAWRTTLQKGVITGNHDPLIAPDRLTVGKLLQEQGYHTGIVGKWHLGFHYEPVTPDNVNKKLLLGVGAPGASIPDGPLTRGFDYYYGFHHAREMGTVIENDKVIEDMAVEKMLPMIAKKSVAYLKERAKNPEQPFFLYVPFGSPHTPIVPTKAWQGKSGLGSYADFVMETDWGVGEILHALDELELTDDTLVIFSSDNGCSKAGNIKGLQAQGHFPSAQYRGSKADIWEGGHRVPFFARWPGKVKPASTCADTICLTDLIATCAEITRTDLPANAGEDSVSFLSDLKGTSEAVNREATVHHSIAGKFALRQGDWKLALCAGSGGWSTPSDAAVLKAGGPAIQLYNLAKDESEKNNLANELPERREAMVKLLKSYVAKGRSTPGAKQQNDAEIDIFKVHKAKPTKKKK